MKGEELRHIINCMVVQLSDSDFRELMQTLDPGGTGLVDVRAFTRLLEEASQVSSVTTPCLRVSAGRELSILSKVRDAGSVV